MPEPTIAFIVGKASAARRTVLEELVGLPAAPIHKPHQLFVCSAGDQFKIHGEIDSETKGHMRCEWVETPAMKTMPWLLLVDTPGLGMNSDDDFITYQLTEMADVCLMFVSATQPGGLDESEFIEHALAANIPVHVCLCGDGDFSEEERLVIQKHLSTKLADIGGASFETSLTIRTSRVGTQKHALPELAKTAARLSKKYGSSSNKQVDSWGPLLLLEQILSRIGTIA